MFIQKLNIKSSNLKLKTMKQIQMKNPKNQPIKKNEFQKSKEEDKMLKKLILKSEK